MVWDLELNFLIKQATDEEAAAGEMGPQTKRRLGHLCKAEATWPLVWSVHGLLAMKGRSPRSPSGGAGPIITVFALGDGQHFYCPKESRALAITC